jgi:tetratricopeptide (TPR) repeat protein
MRRILTEMLKPMKILQCVFCLLLAGAADLHAEALVKPLPKPDLAKVPADLAKQLTQVRAAFDKEKINLDSAALGAGYAQLGGLYFHAGLLDVADIAFYDATQLAPKDARWLYMRGVLANAQKRSADARANFEAALALDQNYPPIRYRLADTLIELGDLDGAHKLLDSAYAQHKNIAILPALLGRLEIRQQRYADAVTHLQAALALEPQANALYKDLADAYTAQGNAQAARDAQAKVGSVQPELADPLVAGLFAGSAPSAPPALSGTPLQQARQLLAQRRFAQARDKVDEVLKAQPDDAEALALAARLDALFGESQRAAGEAEHALKLAPTNASTNLSAGMVYEFAGDDAKARTHYQRALQADPNQPDARLLLGNALMRHGDYAQAAEQYRQLAAIAPTNDNADARVAAALVAAGKCSDALADLNAKLAKRAQDGDLMQVFVRVTSTCPAASQAERGMALDYAQALYKQRPDAGDSSALALAQAANGKFEDAQKSQAEAIFQSVRSGDNANAKLYRETMQQFAAKQVPDRPWPMQHPYFHPPLLTPLLPNTPH